MNQQTDLIYYPDASQEFYAVHYSSDEDFNLELGEDFTSDADDISEEDLRDWAENSGYLEVDSIYTAEDGTIYYEKLREKFREEEEDYPGNQSYPSGRAFDWFSKIHLKFPKSLGVSLVDGASPGNDWRGVIVSNYDSLKKLQSYLAENGFCVNFKIGFE